MYRSVLSRVALLIALIAVPSHGAASILLLSSTSDLTQLEVGSTVQIDVSLSGLDLSDSIYLLYSRSVFPSSFFDLIPDPNNSSGLTPGAILPLASQVSTFNALSSVAIGSVTGKFAEQLFSPLAISTNGVYYSFMLRAISPGSGVIRFDPSSTLYVSDSTGFNLAPIATTGGVPFTIAPVAAVPEPSTLVMLTSATMVTLGRRWHRRRRGSLIKH